MHASNIRHCYFYPPVYIFKVFKRLLYFLLLLPFLSYCTEIVQNQTAFIVFWGWGGFAPADRMIMTYVVPVCPCKPFSADAAAVLHMPV